MLQANNAPSSPIAALLYVGVDSFRPVNEGYGLRVGDAVLDEIGRRLCARAGPGAWVSRVGGDEFVVLATGGAAEGAGIADALIAAMREPLALSGLRLTLSVSVGVALYPEHSSLPRLVAHAGLAMRAVKLGGGSGYAFFHPSMSVDLREQAELAQELRGAAQRGQLQLVYQPKVDARSLQVTAAEALLRWLHPQRGVILPAVFIPLAERHGLMHEIGLWVVEEACRQDDTVERIEECVRRHGLRPLTCEITESLAMEDTAHTRRAFERLKRAGLHVSIDDFGTGHSSLATLRQLPAAELKIDRAFVADLADNQAVQSIVQAIVQMAHSLSLRVVAEGVETTAQRDLLVALGCDELQGFLFARPMSARAIALWAADEARPDGGPSFRASLFETTKAAPL